MTSSKTPLLILILILIIAVVTGCGGGGNSGNSSTAMAAPTYTVSDQITLSGSGLAGVTVTMTGTGSSSTTTDASGNYSFTGTANGSYTITPSKGAYTFTPASISVTVSNANVTGQNFAVITYTISGTVTLNGSGLADVMITMTGTGSSSTTTDASGNYSFTGVVNGSYTITPSMGVYTFNPANIYVTVSNTNVTGQDFTTGSSANNIMTISVNGSLCSSNSYVNKPCVSVTVCSPGTLTCQTINDILLDTGSSGLRIFKQALTVSLVQQTIGAGSLVECIQYGDGTSEWGPVQIASVILGNEPAIQIPIEVVDYTFGTAPAACQNTDTTPSQAGFNGIIGVGLFAQDCGSGCSDNAGNGMYYSCIGSTCNGTAVPISSQVGNPVALLPKDNNGVIVKLPGIPVDGLSSVSGSLVFGIGTQSNNTPSAVTAYPTDVNGNFITLFSGTSYAVSYIDSGTNGFSFPSLTLSDCRYPYSIWFCPMSTTSLSATISGVSGTPSSVVSFQIGNFSTLINSSNNVFDDIGGNDVGEFAWGLPFYFGRDVYHGIEGTVSSLGSGPYCAY